MGRKFLDGCGAVLFCVGYNALFGLVVVLTVFGLAGAAWLAAAAGVPRQAAADILYLAPVLLFVEFWFFFLRGANFDHFGDGGD